MKKRKICIIVASRANYGRIKTVLQAIKNHPQLELQLILEASALLYRYGSVIDTIKKDGFEITAKVYNIVDGGNLTTMSKSTGLGIIELSSLFEQLQPDVVLTVADRFETMATAIAATYMNIPLAHTQGGELTGSIDESVRHAISKLAHIHFPSNELAASRLFQMGETPDRVYVTGCPAIDLAAQANREELKNVLDNYGGSGNDIDWEKDFVLVLQHPVTTEFGQGFDQIQQTLQAINKLHMQTVWLWPNVDAGSDEIAKGLRMFLNKHPEFPIRFYRNFSPSDYISVLRKAKCLIGNSSSGIRESAYLGTPVVNIGTRQQDRQRGANVIDVDYDAVAIEDAVRQQLANGRYASEAIYGDGYAGTRIADILATCELNIVKRFHHV